jgi:hypothetical protein
VLVDVVRALDADEDLLRRLDSFDSFLASFRGGFAWLDLR